MRLEEIKLSCVVCTLRAPASIDKLFDSLLGQEWVSGDEFIVIDNGLSPERRQEIEERLRQFPNGVIAQCHREPEQGVVKARLKSIAVTKNPWLLSLDDDNALGPGALRRIRERLLENPTLGGICPRIEPDWEVEPPPWVVALGHQVLSFNASPHHATPCSWQLWSPGVIGQRPPTGGMIIARCVAEDFVKLCHTVPLILSFTPTGPRRMTGEDFILYSLIYIKKDLSTAYDDSIVVRHAIPVSRTTLSYLLRTLFWSNYSFGIQGLMRFGKMNVLYVIFRGLGRLCYEMARQRARILSWRILAGYLAGCFGFLRGVIAGLVDPECKRIRIDP